jgi:predicted DNA-binding protein (MmcQ/YjbR family)
MPDRFPTQTDDGYQPYDTEVQPMPKMTFNPEVKEVLDSFLLENPEVEAGKAFGLPAYYVNGKMFASVYENGATIKVPIAMVEELLQKDGISEFRPMDKHVMKNWVLIEREDPEDLVEDRDLFDKAFEYVLDLTTKK